MNDYKTPDLFTRSGFSIVPPTPEEVAKSNRRPRPYVKHSATSRAAAAKIEPVAGTFRMDVLEYIKQCGERGATDQEIQIALDMNPSTQRPRRIELVAGGFVVKSDVTRPTSSGRQATVWKVAAP